MSTAAQVPDPATTATVGMGGAGDLPPTITIPAGLKFDNTLGTMFIGCILGTLSVFSYFCLNLDAKMLIGYPALLVCSLGST